MSARTIPNLEGVYIGPVGVDGWEIVGHWLMVKGHIDLPGREPDKIEKLDEKARDLAPKLIAAAVEQTDWKPATLGEAVTSRSPNIEPSLGGRMYPLGPRYGASEVLVTIADMTRGEGEWHYGYAPPFWPKDGETALLVKIRNAEVVAILAPARR